MSGQQQHVDIHRKLLLRRRLCSKSLPGAVYAPFVGDGDIATEVYAGRVLYGADIDPARIVTVSDRIPAGIFRVAVAVGYPFSDVEAEFAIADFDAYANPYLSLAAFWKLARKTSRIVIFCTDGLRQRIARGRCLKALPSGGETPATLPEIRRAYNFHWIQTVKPWVAGLIAPATIASSLIYLRKGMLYWGAVIENVQV